MTSTRPLSIDEYGNKLISKVRELPNVTAASFLPQRNRNRILLSLSFSSGQSMTEAYQYPDYTYKNQIAELDKVYGTISAIASHYEVRNRGQAVLLTQSNGDVKHG